MYKPTKITTKAVFDMETGELLHWEGYDYAGPLDLCEGAPAAVDPGTPDGGGGNDAGGDEQYFLEIDDRTRYKTADEAVRGYQEAGQRIAELTPWQQIASEYGLTDPQDIAALADELAELRARANAGTEPAGRGNAASGTTTPAVAAPSTANLDPNSPEGKEAAAIQWLVNNREKAGLLSADALNQLNERLDMLTQEAQRVDDERFEQRMEYGRNVLTSELKAAGFYPTDAKDTNGIKAATELSAILEDALTTWVNADDRRVAAFHAGGEQLANLIKTGLQRILPTFNVLRSSSGATDAARRTNTVNRTRTATVGNGAPARAAAATAPRNTGALKAEDGITPEVHAKAWEVFSKIRGEQP